VGEELSSQYVRYMGGRGQTLGSNGDDDTESSEDGQGGTDDNLHGVVRGVVGCPGTVWAESDKVGCISVAVHSRLHPSCPKVPSNPYKRLQRYGVMVSTIPGRVQLHEFPMTFQQSSRIPTYQPSSHLSSIPSNPASGSPRAAGRPRTAPRPVDSSMMPRCWPRWERKRWFG
jgi:hypothetical protein